MKNDGHAIPGRAHHDWQKRECIEQLLAVWISHPELRLMQLIGNARPGDTYYTEDMVLVQDVIDFYKGSNASR